MRRDRRAEREQFAADLLAKLTKGGAFHERWFSSAAEIAQWLNGLGLVTYHRNFLVSAQAVQRWAKQREMPARAGAGRKRGCQASMLTLIAWLHSGQRCVSTPRNGR